MAVRNSEKSGAKRRFFSKSFPKGPICQYLFCRNFIFHFLSSFSPFPPPPFPQPRKIPRFSHVERRYIARLQPCCNRGDRIISRFRIGSWRAGIYKPASLPPNIYFLSSNMGSLSPLQRANVRNATQHLVRHDSFRYDAEKIPILKERLEERDVVGERR